MRICKICGTENSNKIQHCEKCGSPLSLSEKGTNEIVHKLRRDLVWYLILIILFISIFLFTSLAPDYFTQNIEINVTSTSVTYVDPKLSLISAVDITNKNPFDITFDNFAYDVNFLNPETNEYEYVGSGSITDVNLKGNSVTHVPLRLSTNLTFAHPDFETYGAIDVQITGNGHTRYFNLLEYLVPFENTQNIPIF